MNYKFDDDKLYHITTIDRVGKILSQGLQVGVSSNDREVIPQKAIYLTCDPVTMIEGDIEFRRNDLCVFEVDRKGITSPLIEDEEWDYKYDGPEDDEGHCIAWYTKGSISKEYIWYLGKLSWTSQGKGSQMIITSIHLDN